MRRALVWVIGLGCAGLALSVFLGESRKGGAVMAAQKAPAAQPAATPAVSAEAAKPAAAVSGEEKVAYSFKDEAEMQEFARLWQQRQAIVLRMTVLQSYWNEEQASLSELNSKISNQYKLDTTKNYALDPKQRALVERHVPLPSAPSSGEPAKPTAQ